MQKNDSESQGVRNLTITAHEAGQRIDNFLGKLSNNVPKSHIYRIIRTGQVRVNGGRVKAVYKLQAEDQVRVPPLYAANKLSSSVPDSVIAMLEAAIISETDDLIVLNKPVGIAVHRGTGLHFGVIEAMRQSRNEPRLELIHRLDRGTSGCLLLGKNPRSTRDAQNLFRDSKVDKRYLALVAGDWEASDQRIELPLVSNQLTGGERKVTVSAEGKVAISIFSTLARLPGASLMSVKIETGRTHQIRVSAAHAGHAIIGDVKYGSKNINQPFRRKGLKRLFLHAAELSFEDGSGFHVKAAVDEAWVAQQASLRPSSA